MRLHKYMASCGIASRRKCEDIILKGEVSVNDVVITELGHIINPISDIVTINNKIISQEEKYYFLFNKPAQVLCSAGDSRDRKTVYNYFKKIDARLFTVGRLDYKTSGLIILTNDGEFANHISHPRYNCTKEYQVTINAHITYDDIKKLQNGIIIDDYKTAPAKVIINSSKKNSTVFNIILHEGKNKQVRKMVETLGYKVLKLERVKIGKLLISGLKSGQFRPLTDTEIKSLGSVE